ncbi:MAG: AarF/ABC1/UbiB kinase family protein [Pirellulales bacterium]|nr:AarF/ABC1/UbiB kinase family protein [Pirellulales bacterium]
MRISSIPQIYRHLNRWYEIVAVLIKYELAAWIGRLGPDFAKDILKTPSKTAIARHRWETRLRMALSELGPTFIKLGQILSTRPDLVGVTLAEELQSLQADAPADPSTAVRKLVEAELGRKIEEVFDAFEDAAMASASIGQVHRAVLKTGEKVVVKVLHADIERKFSVDLDILAGLAQLAEMIPEFQPYRPRTLVGEFQRALRRELDFARELRNLQQFIHDFRGSPIVRFPQPYPELSTRRVLTMELLEGRSLLDLSHSPGADYDLDEIARRGATVCLEMIFSNGFYHADPHPSNILVMPDGVIGMLDCGMVGRLDEQLQDDFCELLLALGETDAEYLTTLILRIGKSPGNLDRASLSLDVTDFLAHYASQPIEHFDLSGALKEMTEIIRRYHIMLPARIAMLLKALITLEGTAQLASPRFSLVEMMRPYRKKMLWRRMSPKRRLKKFRRFIAEMEHLIEYIPRGVIEIFEQVQSGKFDVHLDHRGLEPSVNRLVYGLVTSSMLLSSALLLCFKVLPIPYFPDISSVGLIGGTIGLAMGYRLHRAINKSGHLGRPKRD